MTFSVKLETCYSPPLRSSDLTPLHQRQSSILKCWGKGGLIVLQAKSIPSPTGGGVHN